MRAEFELSYQDLASKTPTWNRKRRKHWYRIVKYEMILAIVSTELKEIDTICRHGFEHQNEPSSRSSSLDHICTFFVPKEVILSSAVSLHTWVSVIFSITCSIGPSVAIANNLCLMVLDLVSEIVLPKSIYIPHAFMRFLCSKHNLPTYINTHYPESKIYIYQNKN